jgi:hypothetical protein
MQGWEGGALILDAAGRPHISYYSGDALKVAHGGGVAWEIETVDPAAWGAYNAMAIDAQGLLHISYWDNVYRDLNYARQVCFPVESASLAGPVVLPQGISGSYSAACTPLTATTPVSFTWNDGSHGDTASYSWATTGTHTVAVTATNYCGQARDQLTVTVFCQPIEGVEIRGPWTWIVSRTATYRAVPRPITASLPLTFTWDNGAAGPNAVYSWQMTGTYTLTVTATNTCGDTAHRSSLQVDVIEEWPYHCYVPLVLRGYEPHWGRGE